MYGQRRCNGKRGVAIDATCAEHTNDRLINYRGDISQTQVGYQIDDLKVDFYWFLE